MPNTADLASEIRKGQGAWFTLELIDPTTNQGRAGVSLPGELNPGTDLVVQIGEAEPQVYALTLVTTVGANYEVKDKGKGLYAIYIPGSGGSPAGADTGLSGVAYVRSQPDTGALSIKREVRIIDPTWPNKLADSLEGGSSFVQSNLGQWLGTAPLGLTSQRVRTSVSAMENNVITAASIAAGALTSVKAAADFFTAVFQRFFPHSGALTGTPTASALPLAASASAVDGTYTGQQLLMRSGVAAGQSHPITGYVGATKIATFTEAWNPVPAAGDSYIILDTD